MRVNCNISAVIANSKLKQSQSSLDKAIARLSSGLKINSAEDDAAGLAIANRLHTQIKGLEQSSKNVADGVSVVSTAESALTETHSILQRIRELAVQAASDTNSAEDKQALQLEVSALLDEVDRISTDTEFNTMPLLDGTLNRRCYSDTDGVAMLNVADSVASGDYKFVVNADAEQATAKLTIDETAFPGAEGSITINGSTLEIAAADTYDSVRTKLIEACDYANVLFTADTPAALATYEYGSDQSLEYSISDSLAGIFTISDVKEGKDVNIKFADTDSGFSKTASILADGKKVTITDLGGFEMTVEFEIGIAEKGPANVTEKVTDIGSLTVQMGTKEGQILEINIPTVSTHVLGIEYVNICTSQGADDAIKKLDDAIDMISDVRAKLGAYQNRMEESEVHLDTYAYNITAAVSRIEDTDMAEEMTTYTSQNVISQAATSMLAQANERPQTVLQLLSR